MEQMEESDRRELLCHLIAAMERAGSWVGETQIQKSVMFLQQLMGVPMGYQFVLYKHGPFSFDLRSELAVMRAGLRLDVEHRMNYGPSFTLGKWGLAAIEKPTAYENEIQFVAERISTEASRPVERISTAFYMTKKYPEQSNNEIAKEINRLKPHISETQALLAIEDAERLRAEAAEMKNELRLGGS